MCVCCTCGRPSDAHGSTDHILIHDLERAAEAENSSVVQVADRIKSGAFARGNTDHITRDDLERAARATNNTVDGVASNIKASVDQYTARSRPMLQNQGSDAGPG